MKVGKPLRQPGGKAEKHALQLWTVHYRAMLCIRGTIAVGLCPSVCVCLCLSQAGVLLKRQNVGSHKQHHTIPSIWPGLVV